MTQFYDEDLPDLGQASNSAPNRLSRRQMLKRSAILGTSLALGLQTLAACGDTPTAATTSSTSGSTNATTTSGSASTSASGSAPAITKTVRLGWGQGGITYYAKTRGVFENTLKQKGIGVQWVGPFPNHAPSMQAVVGGSADFSFGGSSTPALAAIIAGNPLVFTSLILSDPRTTSIIVKPNSGINTVKDLVGKKVAVNRSGLGEFLLIAALEKYNIPVDQVQRVYLDPPDAAPAFGADKVDAWSIWSGPLEIAENQYNAKAIFIEGKELSQRIDVSSFLVLDSYAKNNADVVSAVLSAYNDEITWANQNTDAVTALLAKLSNWPPAVVAQVAGYKTQSVMIKPNDTSKFNLQVAADWLADHKIIPSKITVADHFANLG